MCAKPPTSLHESVADGLTVSVRETVAFDVSVANGERLILAEGSSKAPDPTEKNAH
jgi:hypothetical protein